MKKIYLFLCACMAGTAALAQTVPGGDMESWRDKTAGTSPIVNIHAPTLWYSFDSLTIADGEAFSPLVFSGYTATDFKAQLYKESTITHGGSFSAKLMTQKQDTFGVVPGSLSNAVASLDIAKYIATKSLAGATAFSGGAPVTQRPKTVSAWVQYVAGMDTTMHPAVPGVDSASLLVQAVAHIGTKDSVIGTGTVNIGPSTSWGQVTANITYAADTTDSVTLLRVIFSSSNGGGTKAFDSSTLYVDDVTMTGIPYVHTTPVDHTGTRDVSGDNAVSVYPNPANGTLYVKSVPGAGLSCRIIAMNGRVVKTATLSGNDAIDVSALAAGAYHCVISDAKGGMVRSTIVTVTK